MDKIVQTISPVIKYVRGRRCKKCGEVYPLSEFYLYSKNSSRKRYTCKKCLIKISLHYNSKYKDHVNKRENAQKEKNKVAFSVLKKYLKVDFDTCDQDVKDRLYQDTVAAIMKLKVLPYFKRIKYVKDRFYCDICGVEIDDNLYKNHEEFYLRNFLFIEGVFCKRCGRKGDDLKIKFLEELEKLHNKYVGMFKEK